MTNNGFGGEWADLAEEIEQRALAELVDMGAERYGRGYGRKISWQFDAVTVVQFVW